MYFFRKGNRLKGYDYCNPNYYFITICIENNQKVFGKIANSTVILNDYGSMAEKYLEKIPSWFHNVALDYLIIMPDHIHLILKLEHQRISRPRHTLSAVIGTFKCQLSHKLKLMGLKNFHWKRSFFDRIIRNEEELNLSRQYIFLNPLKAEIKERNKNK